MHTQSFFSILKDCSTSHFDDLKEADHGLFEDIIWPALFHRVEAFGEIKLLSSWAGFYDYNVLDQVRNERWDRYITHIKEAFLTTIQNAIIGRHSEIENMLICSGFSGHGLQQSPAAGRAIAELVQSEGQRFDTLDLSNFSFERVVNGRPIYETGIV